MNSFQFDQTVDSYTIDLILFGKAILILIAYFIIAQVFSYVFKKIFALVAKRMNINPEAKAMKILNMPIFYSIVLFGAYQSFIFIGSLSRYSFYVIKIIESIAVIIWIYSLAGFASIIISRVSHKIAKKRISTLDDEFVPILRRLSGIMIYFFGIMIVLKIWNLDITPFLASAGIAGFVLAFAAQDTIAHLFGGVSIYFDKPFKIGDRIQLESGEIGDVLDIGIRSTRIKTFDETVIIIPNRIMAGCKIINYNLPESKIKCKITIGVSYDSDIDKVKNILLEIANSTEDVAKNPAPAVYFSEFGEYDLKFLIITWVAGPKQQFDVKTRMNEAILKKFRAEGVIIPYPTRDINLRK